MSPCASVPECFLSTLRSKPYNSIYTTMMRVKHQPIGHISQREPRTDCSGWINSDPTESAAAPRDRILSGWFVVSLISTLLSSPSDVVGWGRISETPQCVEQLRLSVGQHWDNLSNNQQTSDFKGLSPLNHRMPNHRHCVPNNWLKLSLNTSCLWARKVSSRCLYLFFLFVFNPTSVFFPPLLLLKVVLA